MSKKINYTLISLILLKWKCQTPREVMKHAIMCTHLELQSVSCAIGNEVWMCSKLVMAGKICVICNFVF